MELKRYFLLASLLLPLLINAHYISMGPAVTETLFALGLGEKVVGVSQYCNYPEKAKVKIRVGTPFTPNLEKIISLAPRVIFTQNLADTSFIKKMKSLKLKVRSLSFNRYSDIIKSIESVAELTNKRNSKILLNEFYKAKLDLEKLKLKGSGIAVVEVKFKHGEITELMGAGVNTYLGDLIEMIGLENSSKSKGYSYLSMETLLLNPPSYIYLLKSPASEEVKLKKFLKDRGLLKTRVVSFQESYANIPGPRLRLLMRDLYEFHQN
jgi:iron complex transport system substrate-binding protein